MAAATSVNTGEAKHVQRPVVELREYDLHPHLLSTYMGHTTKSADLRKSLVPLRLFTLPDTGGKINVATHFYYYEGGHAARDEARAAMAKNSEWLEYLTNAKTCMQGQRSTVFTEAPLVARTEGVPGLAEGQAEAFLGESFPGAIYELRRYKLQLGYDTVPRFLDIYEKGLPSKLNAEGTDSGTNLITLLYTEVGILNEVIELWRHDGTGGMEKSRVAARGAAEWREAIAQIAGLSVEFTTCIHRPTGFSPLR